MRSGRVAALVVGALLVLSGCVAIPVSGDVQIRPIDVPPEDAPNVALPPSPVAGQSPVEIVQGFLNAGRAPQSRYSVAREYLAPTAEWSPTSRVLVTSSAINPVPVDDDTVTVTVTVVGEVDASGRYTAVPSQVQTLSYDIVDVDGEFRIAEADPGTVLSRNGFTSAFGAYPLYFYDASFDYLVPDLRWFPISRDVADRIVDELLVGPAAWLGTGVLFSAFPPGTTGEAENLAPRVTVVLDPAVRSESVSTQRRMVEQLRASLRALENWTDLVVTAGEIELAPAGDPAPESVYFVGDGVVGGVDGAFGGLTVTGVVPLEKIGTRANALGAVGATLAPDRASVAVLGSGGVSLVPPVGDPIPIDTRAGLVVPSLDPHGFTWSVPRADPGALVVVSNTGEASALPLPVDGRVVALEVARDGARALVALSTADGPRLIVLGVQRDADLVPVAFGSVYELPVRGPIRDIAWVDGTHVAVLSVGETDAEVEVLALGGPSEPLGSIEGATSIVGGNLIAGIRVLLADGTVYRPSEAGGWRDTGIVASFLGTQQ